MIRYKDWPEKLIKFLIDRDKAPMKWGVSDCTLFAADAVETMNGSDPAQFFRGKYKDKRGAFRILKKFSGGGLEEAVERVFREMGYPEIPTERANSGDVVLMDVENVDPEATGYTTGIMATETIANAQVKDGLVYLPTPTLKRAWAI